MTNDGRNTQQLCVRPGTRPDWTIPSERSLTRQATARKARTKEHTLGVVLMTPKQVAGMLSVSQRSVLRMPIPRVVLGPRSIRYELEAVNDFVEARAHD